MSVRTHGAADVVDTQFSRPRLDGIYVAPTNATLGWSPAQWEADLRAMREVGMSFFIFPHPAIAAQKPTDDCPLGIFDAAFNLSGLAPLIAPMSVDCFRQVGRTDFEGGVVETVLHAAQSVGLRVHLGGAWTNLDVNVLYSSVGPARAFAALQRGVLAHLWRNVVGRAALQDRVLGFYTEAEESNWWPAEWWPLWTSEYLTPVASAIKSLAPRLRAFASPYSIGNRTRYNESMAKGYVGYGNTWEAVLRAAPGLDFVAMQDSVGAQGNSQQNASDALGNVTRGAMAAGRDEGWANVEIFQTWPASCRWSPKSGNCKGRHPAPFARWRGQIEAEWAVLLEARVATPRMVAWEWYSCLSPNGGPDRNATRQNYEQYRAYVTTVE